MKHNLKITLVLVFFFILTQLFGLYVIKKDISLVEVDGKIQVVHSDTAVGPRPDVIGASAFLYIVAAIAVGTLFFLLLVRFRKFALWKIWFFAAVWLTTAITFGVFIEYNLSLIAGFLIALIKIFKKNVVIHNVSEILMYSGIGLLLVPLLNLFWVTLILVVISIYDMYAVWKSKHMVKMAEFQAEAKTFAGFFIPYRDKRVPKAKVKKKVPLKMLKKVEVPTRNAILGGGDITFPLIFSGVVMEYLITGYSYTIASAFTSTLLISVFVAIALFILFTISKKDRYYPAMPFLSAGCFVGYFFVFLTTLL